MKIRPDIGPLETVSSGEGLSGRLRPAGIADSGRARSRAVSAETAGSPGRAPSGWQVAALRTSVQILLAICALVAVLWVLHRVEGVLLVLALSVLFAYLVAPVVSFFRRPCPAPAGGRAPAAAARDPRRVRGDLRQRWRRPSPCCLPVLNAQFTEFRAELPGYVMRLEAGWQSWLKGQTRMLPRDLRAGIDGDRQPGRRPA